MSQRLQGKTAFITAAGNGMGRAAAFAFAEQGATVWATDIDPAPLATINHPRIHPRVLDACNTAAVNAAVAEAGRIDILHANAGLYIGGDLVDAQTDAIDRMLNLNVNVVMKNVRDVLPHMIERGSGDIIVTSSLAAHFPTPWEPVYASSKWAINCFVQTVRRQVFKHGIRVGSISPGPVVTALIADWPADKLKEARESGSLLDASEVAEVVIFMLTRPRGMTIRDVVMLPTNFDL